MYGCRTCRKSFPAGYEARENHCRATGHPSPVFECHVCGANFGHSKPLFRHTSAGACSSADEPHKSDRYFCDLCDAEFSREKDCDYHELYGHFYCYDCDREFSTCDGIQQVRLETTSSNRNPPPFLALSLS